MRARADTFLHHHGPTRCIFKKSVLTTPKTGSFSCRKSVSHERTSTVLKALSDKDTAAQLEVDAFIENCANRWQRREGTYQLERRRLPDAGDAPGYQGANIDMADI